MGFIEGPKIKALFAPAIRISGSEFGGESWIIGVAAFPGAIGGGRASIDERQALLSCIGPKGLGELNIDPFKIVLSSFVRSR